MTDATSRRSVPMLPNLAVQTAAKSVLQQLVACIKPESTEASIARIATQLLTDAGYPDTWYYDCPAFVLLGSRSLLSVSGRDYLPAEERVGSHNLITVDLSPRSGSQWGDCARSFYMEDGICRAMPTGVEFSRGHGAERALHDSMRRFVRPETTFNALYEFANDLIETAGFENLDFAANVGHSLCEQRAQRLYIEAGNLRRLDEVACFTFEPHIRERGGRWGYKHENIYFFNDEGEACEL
ncbi:M24 family metallopeptidase [Pseudomonas sp. Larv2_ips]|uniref:M24 family metallopeptidase n=1 Tax=Pseudomonas sp. Larv2_ips TaxID=1896942 RepID=UPI002115B7C6|nr:M24 family metallopeptidase [Pseudomonas sp. Larv2_ips]